MKFNFDFLTDWTVDIVNAVYRLTIQSLYFILSNSLFLMMLLVFKMTLNNFILFLVPIFLMLISFLTQFTINEAGKGPLSFKAYCRLYQRNLKAQWQMSVSYTLLIAFLVFDFRILSVLKNGLLYVPFLITSGFLISSLFFMILIATDERSKQLSLGRKFFSALLIAYRLPLVTLVNMICLVGIAISLVLFPIAYICILGGLINYLIYLNCQRRFSVSLYFGDMSGKIGF